MKTLVFSDTHLDTRFEEKKYNNLKALITSADNVIVNGDLWDGHVDSFDAFIDSPWKKLFPLLKKKRAVYIYGNHDSRMFSDKRVSLFSDTQSYSHTRTFGKKKYIFKHGHSLTAFPMYFPDDTTFMPNKAIHPVKHAIQTRILNLPLRHGFRYFNQAIKQNTKALLKKNEILFCGHTHFPEVDLPNQFVNTGVFHFGFAEYLWIDKKGNIEAKRERYD